MALSNWDQMSMSHEGKPMSGTYKSPLGVEVSLYKNWIYVRDKNAWEEGGHYKEPTIMNIHNSEMVYKDTTIISKTVNGVLYLITWNGWEHTNTLTGMIGIACYGFKKDKYIGITKNMIEKLDRFRKSRNFIETCIPINLQDVDLNNAKRFNMGDMFFHDEIDLPKQCSDVEKAEEPYLSRILKRD